MINVKSGVATGTGVAMTIDLGFRPVIIEMQISESSIQGFWDSSMRAATFCVEHCAELRTGEILIGKHLPLIGTTDTQIANTRVVTQHDAAGDVRAECAATAAGTALAGAADDIIADKWGCYRMSTASGGAIAITPDTGLNSDTEAEAIALMGALPANEADLGYITVLTGSGVAFDATTDAFAGGASGSPALTTNYYAGYGIMSNGITILGTAAGAAINGFQIGTDAGLNIAGSIITYRAYRS